MHLKFITVTLALAVFGRAASVSPVKGATVASIPDHAPRSEKFTGSLDARSTKVSPLYSVSTPPDVTITLYENVECPDTGVYYFVLDKIGPNQCYPASFNISFESVFISTTPGLTLPYGVYVGAADDCSDRVQVKHVNNCVNFKDLYNANAPDSGKYVYKYIPPP